MKLVNTLHVSIKKVQTNMWIVVSYDREFDKLSVFRKEPQQILTMLEAEDKLATA